MICGDFGCYDRFFFRTVSLTSWVSKSSMSRFVWYMDTDFEQYPRDLHMVCNCHELQSLKASEYDGIAV